MARDCRKSKKARGKKRSEDTSLGLETIEELGGTKADLDLLRDLEPEEQDAEDLDLDLGAEQFDTEPIKKDEIRDFMTHIGIWDHRPSMGDESKKEKKVKLLKAPVEEDDPGKAAPTTTTPDKAASKKERNKFKVHHAEVSSTTTSGEGELRQHLCTPPYHSYLLVKPGDNWMDEQGGKDAHEVSQALVEQAEAFAAKLLEDEITLYTKQRENSKKSESRWIKMVLASGTLSDKMAALTLLVQESSLHNLAAVDVLVSMSRKKGKREAMLASDTLKDLFLSNLLPDDRKLSPFNSRPLPTLWQACSGNKDSVDGQLLCWRAESLLKEKYAAFIKALDMMSYDTILATKQKAVSIMHSLLAGKPEQENVLLPMLVNKLGDPDYRLASKTSYLLIKLVEEHPNMKGVIVAEVERLVYRPNISERAQYYALCFLNQVRLKKTDQALAVQLISIYFTFFKVYVNKGEVDSKMMAALLSGVNRAYPFAKLKRDFLEEQMATLYKIVHIVNFSTSVQALMLLLQVTDPSTSGSDRYFMALYRKIADPALKTSAKQPQFLNLLYKSMRADLCEKRVQAFMKRLLQASCQLGPNFLCGALIVLSEVLKERPGLLNIKQLGKVSTVSHFVGPSDTNTSGVDDGDDEEEHFVDLPVPAEFRESDSNSDSDEKKREEGVDAKDGVDTDGEDKSAHNADNNKEISLKPVTSSWVHRQNLTGKSEQQGYDAYQRNPLYCQAQHECLWELRNLAQHYHPSVSLFARTILEAKPIMYPGDPLQDFTLIRFLDRFVYKNPQKKESASAGEERAATIGGVSRKNVKSLAAETIPVNSDRFLKAGEDAIPEHERYLYRYFSQRAEKKKAEAEEASDADSQAGSVSDAEFDVFLDTYEKQVDGDDLGDMDDYLDFAGHLATGRKKAAAGNAAGFDSDDNSVEEGGDEDVDDDDLSDEEVDFDNDDDDELAAEFRKEMEALSEGEGSEELSGDELKQMMAGGKKSSKRRSRDMEDDMDSFQGKKSKRKHRDAGGEMFAAADEFADLLEGNVDTTLSTLGTTSAVSNKDKAAAKQLAWEAERDRQIRGRDWRQTKQHGKGGFKGKKTKSAGFRGSRPGSKGQKSARKPQHGKKKR